MKRKIIAEFLPNGELQEITFEPIPTCPMCRTAHSGTTLSEFVLTKTFQGQYGDEEVYVLYATQLCEACERVFLGTYFATDSVKCCNYETYLAEKCAWLGNDFTHYVRKHDEGLDVLKALIDATVFWICMECITSDSDQIERR